MIAWTSGGIVSHRRARAILLFAFLFYCGSPSLNARGAASLVDRLAQIDTYTGNVDFEVMPATAAEPVKYTVCLQSSNAPADTLSPCSYLIKWATETPSGTHDGFTAYFDGNLYRYVSGSMMREYHYQSNPAPFAPSGNPEAGVQSTAQFTDLLPQFLSRKVDEIIADTTCVWSWQPDTLVGGRRCSAIDGVKRYMGQDTRYFTYIFDYETGMPVRASVISSPGMLSEQEITVTYTDTDNEPLALSEATLAEMYPDVFAKFRESTFRAENLIGHPLPAFAARLADGSGHYTWDAGTSHPAATIIVVLDPQVSTASATVRAVRDALATSPYRADVIWAIDTSDPAAATGLLGTSDAGETVVTSIGDLQRKCGVTLYPTMLAVDRQGVVREVLPGYNQDMEEIVLQTMALIH